MPLSTIARPGQYDLVIYAGDSVRREVLVREQGGTPVDLTGYIPRAQIRDRAGGKLLAAFIATIPTPSSGVIELLLDTVQTRLLPGAGVWDLELDGGITNTVTILAGSVKVVADVTRI